MLWLSGGFTISIGQWVTFCLMTPSMVAFGAPAMLVGTEEESGTLDWMRSLPVTWRTIALSKFLVAIASVGLASLVSLALHAALIPNLNASLADDRLYLLTWEREFPRLLFSSELLLVALTLAYLLRSPVASVVAIPPVILGLTALPGYAERLDVIRLSDFRGDVLTAIFVVALFVTQYQAAWWRLGRGGNRKWFWTTKPIVSSPVAVHYAPHSNSTLLRKPTPRQALSWQSRRQQLWPTLALSIIAIGLLAVMWFDLQSSLVVDLLQLDLGLLILVATWLGCLCFFSDSTRKRYAFIADRGISSIQFWRTRVWIPSLAIVGIFIASFLVFIIERDLARFPPADVLVAFACGQLASMWLSRSSLAFVLGLALTFGLMMSMQQLFYTYGRYSGYAWLAIIPLLVATARLTRPWLDSRRGFAFHARLVGYFILAMLIVPIGVQVRRYLIVPAAMPQWRTQMLAEPMPAAFAQLEDQKFLSPHDYLAPWLATQDMAELKKNPHFVDFEPGSDEHSDRVLDRYYDLVQKGMGWPVQFRQRVDSPEMEAMLANKFYGWRLTLQWAKAARVAVIEGRLQPQLVLHNASNDELTVIGELSFLTGLNDGMLPASIQQQALSILDEFASPELQDESWRTAMIMEWRLFQQRQSPQHFANSRVDVANAASRNLEQRRINRYVDRATRMSLEWTELNRDSLFSVWQLQNAWRQVHGRPFAFNTVSMGTMSEQFVEDIRTKLTEKKN